MIDSLFVREPLARSTSRVWACLRAAVAYLARAQHPAGSWTDFWLPVGTSDAWVTAYVGLALHAVAESSHLDRKTRDLAANCARRAAGWLTQQRRPLRGWGYNATVPPDADSTAHALSLLARVGFAVPADAVALLRAHQVPGKGFKTYKWHDPDHQWTHPCPDVTAAALRALYDVEEVNQAGLREAWLETLAKSQAENGWWHGYWWMTPNYTTGLVLEVWQAAGRPPLPHVVDHRLPAECAFDLAWAVHARAFCDDPAGVASLVARLVALQEVDGGWPSVTILRVPPSHRNAGIGQRTIMARDARRVFTTATAVRALIHAAAQLTSPPDTAGIEASERDGKHPEQRQRLNRAGEMPGEIRQITSRHKQAERSDVGYRLDELVRQAARAVGFSSQGAQAAADIFATLTEESLSAPCPWPAEQLSSLSGGMPLEFSAVVGHQVRPALRYAAEVGNPFLPPYARARSGVEAVARTAECLGYAEAWQRVRPAIDQLVSRNLAVPDGLRFWVWSGIDQVAAAAHGSPSTPGLKIYLNLLHCEVGGARRRLETALRAAAIPVSRELRELLDRLDEAGFLHEMGFGLGPAGKIACKIYYELRGWQRPLVRQVLVQTGLPLDTDAVCPEIPGILRESLAAKRRAGIALRIDPARGVVRELTTAAAFPPPLLSVAETRRRVAAWIDDQGWDGSCYQALSELLLPAWTNSEEAHGHLHSLFTRTVSYEAARAAIYLRPYV